MPEYRVIHQTDLTADNPRQAAVMTASQQPLSLLVRELHRDGSTVGLGVQEIVDLTPDPEDSQTVHQELRKLQDMGVIHYVLPTDPLGEAWVLGLIDGGLLKLNSNDEAKVFLTAVSVTGLWVGRRQGLTL